MPFGIPVWATLAMNIGLYEVTHSFSIWLAQGPACPVCPELPAIPACPSCPGAPAPLHPEGPPRPSLLPLVGAAALAAFLGGVLVGKITQPVIGKPVNHGGVPVKTVAGAQ